MSAIARRYARAIIGAAEEAGGTKAVDSMAVSLRAFRDAYRSSDVLRDVIHNPAMKEERDAVLEALFPKLDTSEHTGHLIRMLADRDRINILDALVTEVETIADEHAKRLRAYVTAPIELTEKHQKRIAVALEKRFGMPVQVTMELDPDMLGGLICRVGDTTLDHSVRRQLEMLREQLEGRTHA